jgi:hypothetical protein
MLELYIVICNLNSLVFPVPVGPKALIVAPLVAITLYHTPSPEELDPAGGVSRMQPFVVPAKLELLLQLSVKVLLVTKEFMSSFAG